MGYNLLPAARFPAFGAASGRSCPGATSSLRSVKLSSIKLSRQVSRAAGGVLGLGLAIGALSGCNGASVPPPPRAALAPAVAPTPGWQVQLDPTVLGNDLKGAQSLLGVKSAATPEPNLDAPFRLTSGSGKEQPVRDAAILGGVPAHPFTGGAAAATFAWTEDGWSAQGELYRSSGNPRLLSGPLRATLPADVFRSPGPGFAQEALSRWPEQTERLLVADPAFLTLSKEQKAKILPEWGRWEFTPDPDLLGLLGASLAYGRWQGQPLFAFDLKEPSAAQTAIDRRFPESVVPSVIVRHQGSRLRAFGDDGPVWFMRGSTLWAGKGGGVGRMKPLIDDLVKSPRTPSPILAELQRLAGEQSGWHLAVLVGDKKAPLRWGALLRWSEAEANPTGYLVVESPL